jgi:calcineurin-like phosphoesterase family protein
MLSWILALLGEIGYGPEPWKAWWWVPRRLGRCPAFTKMGETVQRSETWFISDLHIGHRMIAEKRGFDTPDAHDEELASRWDASVECLDNIWILGDISAGGRRGQLRALEWLAARPGKKHLVAGNHDSVHPMHEGAHKEIAVFLKVFSSVQQSAARKIAGQAVLLSHFPYLESIDEADMHSRFDQWRLPSLGAWLLHGHLHSRTQVLDKSIHIGVDAWDLAPVSINAVARIIAAHR